MMNLPSRLMDELQMRNVHVDAPDEDTLVLHDVPAHTERFSKPATNLLLQRVRSGAVVVCVDANLEYTGTDEEVQRIFERGLVRSGWKTVLIVPCRPDDISPAVERALELLGKGAASASPGAGNGEGLLGRMATDLTAAATGGAGVPCVGRDAYVDEALSALFHWGPDRFPVIAGPAGIGKTNLLHGMAARLAEYRPDHRLLRVNMALLLAGTLFDAERETLLVKATQEAAAAANTFFMFEHIDLAVREIPKGAAILADALDRGLAFAGTGRTPGAQACLQPPLDGRARIITLPEPTLEQAAAMVEGARAALGKHHDLEIDAHLAKAAVAASAMLGGSLPGKAIAVLDAAAARAALHGVKIIGLDDLYAAAQRLADDAPRISRQPEEE